MLWELLERALDQNVKNFVILTRTATPFFFAVSARSPRPTRTSSSSQTSRLDGGDDAVHADEAERGERGAEDEVDRVKHEQPHCARRARPQSARAGGESRKKRGSAHPP